LALAFNALAFLDIQDHLAVARPAVLDNAVAARVRQDALQPMVSLADRAS
jgi:hypothetical protein